MRVHYNTYRTALENEGQPSDNYHKVTGAQLIQFMELGAKGKSGEALVVAAEIMWVKSFGKVTYYVPQRECEFLLRSKYDCKLVDVADLDVFSVAPHPAMKLPPMLVEISKFRFIVHIEGYKNDRKGTHTVVLKDGVEFADIKELQIEGSDTTVRCAKLAYGVWMFRKAFPSSVVDGFPDEMRERAIRYAKKVTGKHILLPEKYRCAPGAHTRTWHWRHLTSDRFKRAADGSVKVILIPETIVGKVKPKTIVINNESADL